MNKKIKTFFRTLWLSVSSPSYYRDILRANRPFTIKFILSFWFLYATIVSLYLSWQVLVPAHQVLQDLPDKLIAGYPEELVINIEDGQVSTNVSEPYFISVDKFEQLFDQVDDQVLGADSDDIQNFLVIDTQASADDILEYSTIMLLTEDSLVYLDDGGFQANRLDEIKELQIDKASVTQIVERLAPFLNFIIPLGMVFIFSFVFIFAGIGHAIYLFFFALLMFGLAKLMKLKLTYLQSYRLSLHILIIPLVLIGLLTVADLNPALPLQRTVIMLFFAVLVLNKLKTPAKKN